MKYKAAIFDMDGTVLNTLDDLGAAINYTMKLSGHDHNYTSEQVRNFFGSGVRVALQRALAVEYGENWDDLVKIGTKEEHLPAEVTDEEIERLIPIYKTYYDAHCADLTGEYAGISDLIDRLRENGVVTAVVSNKPDTAVQKLSVDYFDGKFDLSVGEQSGILRKPAPDMVLKALKELNIDVKDAVYIGDSEIDLQTAINSGMDCISVTWGFRSREFLENLGAKTIVSDPAEIALIILQ